MLRIMRMIVARRRRRDPASCIDRSALTAFGLAVGRSEVQIADMAMPVTMRISRT